MFKKDKKILDSSGFNSLKDFLEYLTINKIKYKCIIDNNGNWCASVGGQSVKKHLKDENNEENNENDNTNNN